MVWQRIVGRFTKPSRRIRSGSRRRLLVEHLTRRELLASDIGAIGGVVFTDQSLDGLTGDDTRLNGVQVQIFEDTNIDGLFDGGDLLIGTDFTNTNGEYRFDGLIAGTYFVQQSTVPGQTPPPVQTVVLDADAADGTSVVTIDTFTSGTQLITGSGGGTQQDSVSAPNALGGERDVQLTHTNASGNTTFQVDTGTELMSLSTGGGATAQAIVEYDGGDNAFGLNVPPGFVPSSLTGGANPANTGLELLVRAENQTEDLLVTIYSSPTEASEAIITIPQSGTLQSVFVRFSAANFTQSGAPGITAPADFNSVVAVRAQAEVTLADNDIFFSVVESRAPTPVTTNLPNVQVLTLGGEVFLDNSLIPGQQNDGIREGTEAGLTGIAVELYTVAGPNDTVDPTTAIPTTSTTTGANGAFRFPGLDPGNYVVVIPDTQFQTGTQLFGFGSSTGNDPAPDPDDNVDDDDNGTSLASQDVISGTITLVSNSEPINDDDTDPNTNTTVDFGFFPQVDLSVTKTVNVAASNIRENGQVVFDIVVQNATPPGFDIVNATNVLFSDTLPAGLSFVEFRNLPAGAGAPIVNGQSASVNLGTIAADQPAVQFQLVADIAVNQTADVTNTAVVATTNQVDVVPANNTENEVVDLPAADLIITKTEDTDPVSAGNQLTYTITVTNNGPDGATGVVVTDNLPSGVTFVSSPNAVTENPVGSGNLTIFLGDIASGNDATATIVVDVDDNAASPLTNIASVVADPNNDPNMTNNTTSEDTAVQRVVDVTVTKNVPTPADVLAGGTFTYEVTVTNNGPSEGRGIQVTDSLDAALTFVSFDAGTSGVTRVPGNDQNLTFDVGTLAAGPANAVTFSFDVSLAASATGSLVNTASVTTTDNDPDSTNNSSTVSSPINRDVDLVITKDVNLTTAVPGASLDETPETDPRLIYVVDVTNNGVSDAFNVMVTDDLSDVIEPDRLINVAVNAPGGTPSFDTITDIATVNFGTIPAGETRQFTIASDIASEATADINNVAVVDADDTNPLTSNSVTTTLTPEFDLIIDKSVTGASMIGPNEQVTFTMIVSHDTAGNETSPSTATGVIISDNLPDGLTFVSATLGGLAVTLTPDASGDVQFPAFDLDPGQTQTATIVASAAATADGMLTNNVSIATDAGETDVTNNSSSANVTVEPLVDLTVAKRVDAADAQAGGQLTYTIDVTNAGPSVASNVVATDTLPTGVTFVSGTDANGQTFTGTGTGVTVNGQTITVNGGNLAVNGSFSFTISAAINAGATGTVTNNVSVTSDTNETATGNNTAAASTSIDPVTSTISGTVYVDANNNGAQNVGEDGIAGVTITLTGTDSLGNDINRDVTTDVDGNYLFGNLPQGTYNVAESQPPGFRDGQEQAGTGANATTQDDLFTQLGLGVDTDATGFDFGELNELLSKRRFLASSS